MNPLASVQTELLVVTPVAMGIVAVLIWRGCLRPGSLRLAPERNTGLTPVDLFIGFGLMFLGPFIAVSAGILPTHQGPGAETRTVAQYGATMLLSQALSQVPAALYVCWRAWASRPRGLVELGIWPRHLTRDLSWAAVALIAVVPLCMAVGVLTKAVGILLGSDPPPTLGHETLVQMQVALREHQAAPLAMLLVSAILLAPLLEELIFRGLVQSSLLGLLENQQRWPVVFLSAAIFTLIHVGPGVQWQSLPSLAVLAIALGWLYERSGSLLPGVLVHMGFNIINTAMTMWMAE